MIVFYAIFLGYMLNAGQMSRNLKQYQSSIGKELIKIGHEHADLQERTYALLDQVSKMYKLSMSALAKRKRVKRLAWQEQQRALALEQENKRLRRQYTQERSRLSEYSEKIVQLEQKCEMLSTQAVTLEVMKQGDYQQDTLNGVFSQESDFAKKESSG